MKVGNMFHRVMRALLQQYGIDASSAEATGHEVYIMTVEDDIDIHFIGSQAGYLNIVCAVSELDRDIDKQTLYTLLASNSFNRVHPVLVIGLDKDTHSVVLSTRQPLAELNSADSFKLVEAFIEEATSLRAWLADRSQKKLRKPDAKNLIPDNIHPLLNFNRKNSIIQE
ncbi:CesT family type III secretion system chaperone [Brenneria rubrifaciens]|uniref:Tir chaperone family protein n=1 Tax=Brenneria rubrifaciens TaxID=55213 RepID=A0A4P8QRC1_9GAMM|nr:CesT family type III secretion system chaperone [Brenneria rubrifaciens]QCR09116.1 Tir chaperone family protein [Brenneria rubrifaciens]